jgi:L-ascorbate metabolism protein UlaG (beta-lactamase superfamily)
MKTRKLHFWKALGLCALGAGALISLHAQSLQFTGVQLLTNNEAALTFTAPTGRAYRLESSTNAMDWNGLVTFATNVTTSLQHTDSAAPYLPTRYYRATQLSGTNLVAGDHLVTTNGDVIIQPRNHATFVMQWNGMMIYNDPVAAATYAGLPKADLILISHTHSDHFSTATMDAVRSPTARIIASQTGYNSLTTAQKTNAIVLGYGQSTNILGLTVEAVYAFNSNHAPLGFGNGYVITIGAKRIYISGDTGDDLQIRSLPDIDVAFVCINQPFTMTVSAATNCIRAMRPKVVYPYHYRDQSNATTNAATFKQWLGTDLGIEVRLRKWY